MYNKDWKNLKAGGPKKGVLFNSSGKEVSSTLWTKYSMLKLISGIYKKIEIYKYERLVPISEAKT